MFVLNKANMNANKLTPERSLEIITQAIQEAKTQFEEDGLIYVFWGLLTAVAAFSQFFLLKDGYHSINYYPYFLMPLGGLFSAWYYSKKQVMSSNKVSKMISISWMVVSINILILGFGFPSFLTTSLIPIILILIGMAITISGGILGSRILLVAGILLNIAGFGSFLVDWMYQPLIMGIASVVGVLIPGLLLMTNHRKKHSK